MANSLVWSFFISDILCSISSASVHSGPCRLSKGVGSGWSMRRLSLQVQRKREDRTNESRRSSLPSPLKAWVRPGKRMQWVKRSFAAAAVAVDRATKDLFVEGQDDDAHHAFCVPRSYSQFNEFEARYRDLIDTLEDLSMAAENDPDGAATLLSRSLAQDDIDTMLALLRAEERNKTRSEQGRSGGGNCGSGGGASSADRSSNGHGVSNGTGSSEMCPQELVATPCLELLLEERVVRRLCEFGVADRPKGTLALVMGACAALLEQVSHPLLPSQAIHDPISKLVAAASSAGQRSGDTSKTGSTGRDDGHRRALARKADEKVKYNLARLLGAIWRQLREESALLDFFLKEVGVGEHQGPSASLHVNGSGGHDGQESIERRVTLDVFTSLLTLLDSSSRAGQHAREACLVALSVKDRRVGLLVGNYTSFCEQLSRILAARYLALYDALEELQAAATSKASKIDSGAVGPMRQSQGAEENSSIALSLFLQHLRFCNAIGLVAADSFASTRPYQVEPAKSRMFDGRAAAACANGIRLHGTEACPEGDVASSLVAQVRQLVLGEAMGPALTSSLESRAGIAQSVAARIIAELSAGVEGFGVAANVAAARVEEDDCRRQLGPLLEVVASFLVGRGCSRLADGAPEKLASSPVAAPANSVGGVAGQGSAVREVLIERVRSSSRALRVSTLELIASLTEVRDDEILLDLTLASNHPAGPVSRSATLETGNRTPTRVESCNGTRGCHSEKDSRDLRALIMAGGPLEGLRVSRGMVDSFGGAFRGSPIHPSSRRFASKVSLEGYLVEAHQRQIQQLMEARASQGSRLAEVAEECVPDGVGGGQGDTPGGLRTNESASSNGNPDIADGVREGESDERRAKEGFDAAGFVREFGGLLSRTVDAPGSFLHALFDCLENMFESTLDENVALTGVLSNLCLAATAVEVSPVRRLLLVLLFDGTKDAPFRSMRRVLERLWISARARVTALPDAARLLAKARATLGMAASDFLGPDEEEEVEVTGVRSGGDAEVSRRYGGHVEPGGGEERSAPSAAGPDSGGGDGGNQRLNGSAVHCATEQAHFLETFVFIEEFLKELYCALQAKSHVEKDTQGLCESHLRGAGNSRRSMSRGYSLEEAEHSSLSPRRLVVSPLKREMEDRVSELPTSLDEFLRKEELPVFVSAPAL